MIAAIQYGAEQTPVWLLILLAAEAWGCPPWEIASSGSRAIWVLRWKFLAEQRAKKLEQDMKKAAHVR